MRPVGQRLSFEEEARVEALLRAGKTPQEIAHATGVGERSAWRIRRRLATGGELGTRPVIPGFVIKQTSAQLDGDGEIEREWVKQAPEPGEEFEVPAGHAVKGVSALVGADGRILQQWVKTREEVGPADIVAAIKEAMANCPVAPAISPPPANDNDTLTVYPLPDLHLGMLAWRRETGEDYDLKIATARARTMAADLIAQSRPSKHALVLGLGDLFHMNDRTNMTPKSGHILDVDGRWPRVLATGIRLAMDIIEMAAAKHEQVLVRFVPGNHDPDASIALTVALSVFYAGNPRIIVDDDPSLHFYHRFGQVLLGATHGHTMKPERMAMMLAMDRPEDWGATRFRHFLFGHIHHETAKEIGTVRVESFNTIAAKDGYAHAGGYRSGQALNAITFHAERGEVGRHRVNMS